VVARPPLPVVTTLPAGDLSGTSVTLNGSVDPNGAVTKAYFRYGLTTNYGGFTTTDILSATNGAQPVANGISGLTPLTTYHFRLVASNSAGTTNGVNLTFTTPAAPAISSLSSMTISTNGLNGLRTVRFSALVNPNGLSSSVNFQYGLSGNYLTTTSP